MKKKQKMIIVLKKLIHKLIQSKIILEFICQALYSKIKYKKKCVFYMLTPLHGNLGDHALTCATESLFDELGLIEMHGEYLNLYLEHTNIVRLLIGRSTIFINAGGNLGTLWYDSTEYLIRKTIEMFPNNNIIILPETCYYEDSEWGRSEFRKSIEIYNKHKHLKIYTREKISYDLIKDVYNDVELMPDMAMYLNESNVQYDRKGILICLRSDLEKTISDELKKKIFDVAKNITDQVEETDTVLNEIINKKDRIKKLNEKFVQFSKSQLVVTDRLHGMIFAAVTGTPCVVLKSKSYKLEGCYEWIKNLEYIKFIDDISQIKPFAAKCASNRYFYENKLIIKYYDKLKKDVYTIVRNDDGE